MIVTTSVADQLRIQIAYLDQEINEKRRERQEEIDNLEMQRAELLNQLELELLDQLEDERLDRLEDKED
jgi:hypothetical protein